MKRCEKCLLQNLSKQVYHCQNKSRSEQLRPGFPFYYFFLLFNRYRFRKVSRLVNIGATHDGNMISEQLQRNH